MKGSWDVLANSGGQDGRVRRQLALMAVLAHDWTPAAQLPATCVSPQGQTMASVNPTYTREWGAVSASDFFMFL